MPGKRTPNPQVHYEALLACAEQLRVQKVHQHHRNFPKCPLVPIVLIHTYVIIIIPFQLHIPYLYYTYVLHRAI